MSQFILDQFRILDLLSSLDSLSKTHISNNTHTTIMLCGDFNVADIDWESNTSIHGSPMQALADNLLSTMADHDLFNLQHAATRCDNVLDLFCTNKPGLVKSVSTIPGFSDHSFILVDTVLKPVTTKKKPRKIYKWDKADWESVKQFTRTYTSQTIESEPSVEEAYSSFLQHVQGILGDDKLIPSGWTRTRHDVPWQSRELKRQCNKKHWLYNEPRKQRSHSIGKLTIWYPLQPRRHSRRLIGNMSTWSSTQLRRDTTPNPSGITAAGHSGRTQWECPLWKRRASCTLTRRPRPLSFRTNLPQCLPQTTLPQPRSEDGRPEILEYTTTTSSQRRHHQNYMVLYNSLCQLCLDTGNS